VTADTDEPRKARAAGYIRAGSASLKGQNAPADQRRRIEEAAGERGWELVAVYEDVGDSSGRDFAALYRMLDEAVGFDKVVVTELDRLGLYARRTLEILSGLEESGTDLVALREGIDTGTEAGPLLLELLTLVTRWEPDREWLGEGWRPANIRKEGFDPATVVDVGAGRGTPVLYNAYPEARHVLLEPLAELEPQVRPIAEQRGEYVMTAVGAADGMAVMNVEPRGLLSSSLNEAVWREEDPQHPVERREVPIATLDTLRERHRWTPPFGLKIDTEGHEDQVILGATRFLEDTQFVLAEISISKRFEGSYTFAEFIALMDSRGFELCDVFRVMKYTPDEASFVDALFRRKR
jgi:FkbM family methyltransferase